MADKLSKNEPEVQGDLSSKIISLIVIGIVVVVCIVYYVAKAPSAPTDPSAIVIDGKPVETIILEDIAGKKADGKAIRYMQDGKFTHEIVASLPVPGEGTHYEGWLMESPTLFVSTGKLELLSEPVYTLSYVSDTDYNDYLRVVVTLQPDNVTEPDLYVLEGYFSE